MAVVRDVLAPLVDKGSATVQVTAGNERHRALIEIRPSRETGCPITIHVEAPGD